MNFEKKLVEGSGGVLARISCEEMKRRIAEGKELSGWEKERRKF